MKQRGGSEIDVYHVKIEGATGKFAIGIKHFKLMTEAANVFKEEQMSHIAKVVPPTPAASKALFDPNKIDCEATADSQPEILIIQPW